MKGRWQTQRGHVFDNSHAAWPATTTLCDSSRFSAAAAILLEFLYSTLWRLLSTNKDKCASLEATRDTKHLVLISLFGPVTALPMPATPQSASLMGSDTIPDSQAGTDFGFSPVHQTHEQQQSAPSSGELAFFRLLID